MADLTRLPWFLAIGQFRGSVPDTLDVGFRPDEFRPWGAVTFTPTTIGTDNKVIDEGGSIELLLKTAVPPLTVVLTPVPARIETGVLRLPREPAPPLDQPPPSLEETAEQQVADGVPLLAQAGELELGTKRLAWHVTFDELTILGRTYRYRDFYFLAPAITNPYPDRITITDATGGTWTVKVNGSTTGVLSPAISTNDLQAAIVALPNVGPGDIVVSGSVGDYTLTWGGALAGSYVDVVVNGNLLTGTGHDIDHVQVPTIVDLTTVTRFVPVAA